MTQPIRRLAAALAVVVVSFSLVACDDRQKQIDDNLSCLQEHALDAAAIERECGR